jgi:Zn-dependent metalloprotease
MDEVPIVTTEVGRFVSLIVVVGVLTIGTGYSAPPSYFSNAKGLQLEVQSRFGAQARVIWNGAAKSVRSITSLNVKNAGKTARERAHTFLNAHRDLIPRSGPSDTLHYMRTQRFAGGHVVSFQQRIGKTPVEGRLVRVAMDNTGRIHTLNSDVVPLRLAPSTQDIGLIGARETARVKFGGVPVSKGKRVVLVLGPNVARYAYSFIVARVPLQVHDRVWIDAQTGHVLKTAPASKDGNRGGIR